MLERSIFLQFYQLLKTIIRFRIRSGLSFFSIFKLRNELTNRAGHISLFKNKIKYSDAKALLHSVEELFLQEVYAFESKVEDPFIIDCGANIGLSIYYFKQLYPTSQILAFEPDPVIFNILKFNVEEVWKFKNVSLENKAVWHESSSLDFFPDGALAGSMVVNFNGGELKPVRIPAIDLRAYLNQRPVDFLKIDIEGAENELIQKLSGHLGQVNNLFLEYHSISNASQNLPEILAVLKAEGFRTYIKEAAELSIKPFIERSKGVFDLQLNMFFYK